MHAVGHVPDGHLVRFAAGPEIGPHASRDIGVGPRDTVDASREPDREHRHVELSVVVFRRKTEPEERFATPPPPSPNRTPGGPDGNGAGGVRPPPGPACGS